MSDINMRRLKTALLQQKAECKFIADLITNVKSLISNSCPCKTPPVGKTVSNTLEYDTIAAESEVITLTIEGFIIYVYEKAYSESYPKGSLTTIQKQRIYEIYDALKIPRPVL